MSTTVQPLSADCPHCGRSYKWKAAIAGRKGRCKGCSKSFRVPKNPPLEDSIAGEDADDMLIEEGKMLAGEDNPYDIHDPDEQKEVPTTEPCASCNEEISSKAVICVHCGYNKATGQKPNAQVKKSGSSKKLLVSLTGILMLAAAAGAGYYFFMMQG